MQFNFKFKNKSSKDFDAIANTKSRTLLPETKLYKYDLPLMDGSLDFTESNCFKRPFYKDRTHEMKIILTADSLEELGIKAAKIAAWLTGSGDLIFSDSELAVWHARVASNIAYTPERYGKKAELSVIFQASAVGEATFRIGEGIRLEDAIYLSSKIPLDMGKYFRKELQYGDNKIKFVNIGDFHVRPKLRFEGDMENITITYGEKKIILERITGGVTVDLEKCTVTDNPGNEILSRMQGSFFELPPGRSEIEVFVSSPCVLDIDYVPKTIYDFDFSDIDWGDEEDA